MSPFIVSAPTRSSSIRRVYDGNHRLIAMQRALAVSTGSKVFERVQCCSYDALTFAGSINVIGKLNQQIHANTNRLDLVETASMRYSLVIKLAFCLLFRSLLCADFCLNSASSSNLLAHQQSANNSTSLRLMRLPTSTFSPVSIADFVFLPEEHWTTIEDVLLADRNNELLTSTSDELSTTGLQLLIHYSRAQMPLYL